MIAGLGHVSGSGGNNGSGGSGSRSGRGGRSSGSGGRHLAVVIQYCTSSEVSFHAKHDFTTRISKCAAGDRYLRSICRCVSALHQFRCYEGTAGNGIAVAAIIFRIQHGITSSDLSCATYCCVIALNSEAVNGSNLAACDLYRCTGGLNACSGSNDFTSSNKDVDVSSATFDSRHQSVTTSSGILYSTAVQGEYCRGLTP